MSWVRKSPFAGPDEASRHMVELLANEAEITGTPLTAPEKEILSQEDTPLPEGLRQKAKDLIRKIFEAEDSDGDPKSFGNSMLWAGDRGYPNVVALAEEVSCDLSRTAYPHTHGWELVKDRAQLIGCAILVVLLMFAIVTVAGIVFHWK
jgi:hypothetical protein